MKKNSLPAALAILLLVSAPAWCYDLLEYFPMTQGSYWIYDDIEYGMVTHQDADVIDGTEAVHGTTAVRGLSYGSNYSLSTPEEIYLFSNDAANIYLHGFHRLVYWDDEPTGFWDISPPLAIPRHLNIGQSSTSSYTITLSNGYRVSMSSTITLLGIETVTVPAGTFADCLKLRMVDSDGETEYMWWAKGIGEVMCQDGPHEFDKLASYYIAGSAPAAPSLSLSVTDTEVSLSWNKVTNAISYILYYAPYPNAEYISSLPLASGDVEISFDLWSGAAFYVAVAACSNSACSSYSNIEYFVLP